MLSSGCPEHAAVVVNSRVYMIGKDSHVGSADNSLSTPTVLSKRVIACARHNEVRTTKYVGPCIVRWCNTFSLPVTGSELTCERREDVWKGLTEPSDPAIIVEFILLVACCV